MLSGEAYDDSDNYIEKVINIYFYGCSVIFHYLRNLQLMSNFTEKEVESLLPLSNQRYYSTYTDPDVISVQIKSIADIVFDIKNKDSAFSHYLAFKYKKKFCRNIFIYLGRITTVPIANYINIKEFSYRSFNTFPKIYDEISRLKSDVEYFLNINQAAIVHHQMYDLI